MFRRYPELGVLCAAGVFLMVVVVTTRQWFFLDEWEFITKRDRPPLSRPGDVLDVLLRPHNEHWSTIPIVVYRAVFGVVGLRAYWPYMVVLTAAHLVLGWMLARRLRREGVSTAVVVAVVLLFAVYGPGAENILWAFQIGWMGSLIAGLWHLELLDGRPDEGPSSSQVRWGWLLGVASLACSGVGITMLAVVGIAVVIRRGWRAAVRATWVPGVVYALWYVTYGRDGTRATDVQVHRFFQGLIAYVWNGLAATVDKTFGLDRALGGLQRVQGVAPVVLVGIIVLTVRAWSKATPHTVTPDSLNSPETHETHETHEMSGSADAPIASNMIPSTQGPSWARVHAVSIALAAGAVIFGAITAVGRIVFDQPDASRYMYMNLAMLAPLSAIHVDQLLRSRSARTAAAVVAGLAIYSSIGDLLAAANREGKRERQIRDEITAAFEIAPSTFASADAFPELNSTDLRISDVRRLLAGGKRPWGQATPRALAIVTARSTVDVTGRPRVPLDASAIDITSLGRAKGQPAETGCVALFATEPAPQVALRAYRPASVKFVPEEGGFLHIFVRRDGYAAPPIPVEIAGGNPVFVNFIDPRSEYVLQFPQVGVTKLCGTGQELPPA